MNDKICMCSVLTNGSTIIYLINDDQSWTEPCIIRTYTDGENSGKVSFPPLQIFGITPVMSPINPMHILTSYAPESQIEESYRFFLDSYLNDTAPIIN